MSERKSRGKTLVFSPLKRTLIVIVLIALVSAIFLSKNILIEKKARYNSEVESIEKLKIEIEAEEEKVEQLKKSDGSALSDEEIESLARSELGLIKRDELVIKPN